MKRKKNFSNNFSNFQIFNFFFLTNFLQKKKSDCDKFFILFFNNYLIEPKCYVIVLFLRFPNDEISR